MSAKADLAKAEAEEIKKDTARMKRKALYSEMKSVQREVSDKKQEVDAFNNWSGSLAQCLLSLVQLIYICYTQHS